MKLVRHYFGSTPKRYASFDIFFEFLAVKSSRNNLPSFIYALSIQRSWVSKRKFMNSIKKKEGEIFSESKKNQNFQILKHECFINTLSKYLGLGEILPSPMGRSFIFQLNNMSWTHLRLLDSSKTSPDVDNRQRFGCWALLLKFTVVVLLAFVGNSYHWLCEDFRLCHSVYTPACIFVSEKFFSGLEFLLFWCNVSGSQRTWNGEHE